LSSPNDASELIATDALRIGMYVELDVGWLSHPFPTSSFKITSDSQLETIRGLGLLQVRWVPFKSAPQVDTTAPLNAERVSVAVHERQVAAEHDAQERRERANLLSDQQSSLNACEKRFSDSARQYRKTLDLLHTNPKEAAAQVGGMVSGLLGEMLAEGESAIRLLSESAGDKFALHPVNVTVVSLLLGKAMGLSHATLQDLGMAAFLHDVGKVQLPERVRWVEENFSSSEYKLYQEHVAQSVLLGKTMELSKSVLLTIAQHHEFADGTGYPSRVKVESIGTGGRILSLVNRYDNLCNPSRTATALTPHESLSLIFSQMKSRFDSVTLSAFIRMMGVYPPGSVVQLIDDRFAIVTSVNSARPLKPRIIVHEPGVPKHEALIVDLEHMPFLGIRRSLKPSALPPATLEYLAPRQRISYFFEQTAAPAEPDVAAD
jgi:HD-GYP domain-containing protein (c-di-GMP phosphodiesterase class II)